MGKTYLKTKKRGKASVAKRLRDNREKVLRLCLSDEYVEENCHVNYYNSFPKEHDDLPPLEVEYDTPPTSVANQSGNRIVNIAYFTEQCIKLAVHDMKCTMGKMQYESERRTGIASCFNYHCKNCDKNVQIYSHPPETKTGVNKMLVWGANSIGIGYAQTEELFSSIDIPMMSKKYFMKIEKAVGENWEEVLQNQMLEAGKEENRQATEAGEIEDGVPFITVIVDGGWAKRSYGHGFSSLSGVAVIIGKRTGKILFLGVRNKYCSICSLEKENLKPHKCFKNYSGASTGMEQDIIIEGFNKSVADHGVRYKYIIGDGDSSVYARIIERVSYGRSVLKLECANHITRCYTSKLHKISLKTQYAVETRKILKSHIPRLCMAVRSAITSNSKTGSSAQQLREDLKNGPYHVFGDHSKCRMEYCKRKDSAEINYVGLLEQDQIFLEICSALDYVVCKADRLVTNATTNYAERYMSLVSKFSGGKRINFCKRDGYLRRCVGAGLSYNNGPSWHKCVVKTQTRRGTYFSAFCSKRRKQCEARKANRKKESFKRGIAINGDMDYGPDAAKPDMKTDMMEKEKQRILLELQNDGTNRISLEIKTRGQHENLAWRIARRNRLTASNFGKICKRLETTSCHCVVRDLLYKSNQELHTPSIVYGRINEKKAIQRYEQKSKKQVTACGLFVSEENPFLAASPDGLLEDGGLVEVKCLYSMRNETIDSAVRKKPNTNLCVSYVDGILNLKKKHNYFYQIQGQLHIANKSYCDFILYTDVDIEIIRIEKDTPFWLEKMIPKLKEFFNDCMLPELADPRVPRGMRIRDSLKIVEAQNRKQAKVTGQ